MRGDVLGYFGVDCGLDVTGHPINIIVSLIFISALHLQGIARHSGIESWHLFCLWREKRDML